MAFLRKQLIKATSATPLSVVNSIFDKGEGIISMNTFHPLVDPWHKG